MKSFRTESAFEVAFEWSEPREVRDKRTRSTIALRGLYWGRDFLVPVDPRIPNPAAALNTGFSGGLGRNRHEALVSAFGQGFHGMFRRLRRGNDRSGRNATSARKRRLQRQRTEMPAAPIPCRCVGTSDSQCFQGPRAFCCEVMSALYTS